jgi:hypothetical protein
MTDSVKTQIVRDFLMLSGEFSDLAYHDPAGSLDKTYMDELGIPAGAGRRWPYSDSGQAR